MSTTKKRALAASFVVTTSTALMACQPATEPQSAPVPEPHRNPPDPGPNPVGTAPATSASATSAPASPSGQVPPRALPVASAPHAMPVPDPPHAVNPTSSSPPPVVATPPDAPPANGKMCDASGARPCIQKSPDGTCTFLPVVTRCPQGVKCNPPPPRRVACPLAVSSEPQLSALSSQLKGCSGAPVEAGGSNVSLERGAEPAVGAGSARAAGASGGQSLETPGREEQ